MSSAFDLVNEPVPVASGFDGDLGLLGQGIEILPKGPAVVFDTDGRTTFSVFEELHEHGVSFVGITAKNRFHDREATAISGAFIRSPLPGLAYANAAVCSVNVFVLSGLRRFRALRVPAPFANANVLILWDERSFARISKSV